MDCREQRGIFHPSVPRGTGYRALAVFTARELRYISGPEDAKKEVLWIIGLGETSRTRVA